MLRWDELTDAELALELRGSANGPRSSGERSSCGRYLVCERPGPRAEWELWRRDPMHERWQCLVASCGSRDRAAGDAERIMSAQASRAWQ